MRTRRFARLLTLGLAFGVGFGISNAVSGKGLEGGWHVVRSGETLEQVAVNYLGSALLWRQIWELNPELANPHAIRPGQRIRVPWVEGTSVPTAQLRSLSGKVESKPRPIPWHAAAEEELLLDEDGIRTPAKASVQVLYSDGARLNVTEESLVFLRRTGGSLVGVSTAKSVEIVEGQAELRARSDRVQMAAVEILVGGARSVSRPDSSGELATRARKSDGGGAKVMMYGGEGEVEAGGASVAVTAGMGTSVPETGPPTPPEKLLPRAESLFPPAGERLQFANPQFRWQPIEKAASYTVEVCGDADCVALLERAVGVVGDEWQPGALPQGDMHWRVTAVSASGLDGYPGETSPLSILSDAVDVTPPNGEIVIQGPQIWVGSRLFVPADVELVAEIQDAESGVERWTPSANGRPISKEEWHGLWTDGDYEVTVATADRVGQRVELAPRQFTVDTQPPRIWHRLEPMEAGAASIDFDQIRQLRKTWTKEGLLWLEWADSGRRWIPLAWGSEQTQSTVWESLARRGVEPMGDGVYNEWSVTGETPQVWLIAPGGNPFAGASPVGLSDHQVLSIGATDDGSGVDHLTLRTRAAAAGAVLEVTAVDLLGHESRFEWQLQQQTRRGRRGSR